MPFRDEKIRRIVQAIMINLDAWTEQVQEIEANAIPGNKVRCLHLLKNFEQAKITLKRLIKDAEE